MNLTNKSQRVHSHSSDNPLQTAVLNLFINLKSRFPNLVVGSITRDSVKRALMNGITADQVGSSNTHTIIERMLITKVVPNSDHQLLVHARASSDEEEREYFAAHPHAVHLLHHMWSLIALTAAASRSETIDPGDRAGSNTVVGVGKKQGQVG